MSQGTPDRDRSALRQRIATAIVGIPLVLVCLLVTTPYPTIALVVAVTFLGCLELQRLVAPRQEALAWLVAGVASIGVAVVLTVAARRVLDFTDATLELDVLLALFCIGLLAIGRRLGAASPSLSALCVACPMAAVGWLQQARVGEAFGPFAANLALIAIVPLWVGDSAAYFVGRSLGKRKLAPAISPNKTWEGAIANLLGCVVGALACGVWLELPTLTSAAVGVTQGVLGQIGDLFESGLKRRAQVKDAGTLLPGHGGILDRVDSLLATAPVVALLVIFR